MPAQKPKPFKDGEKLVAIEELPDWAQPAFAGMKSLNRVQSTVSDAALYSSENMLICAPTGGWVVGWQGGRWREASRIESAWLKSQLDLSSQFGRSGLTSARNRILQG